MKVVTLITRLIRGGAQRIALETSAELVRRGHDARLWCGAETGPEGSLFEEADARGVEVRIFPGLVRPVSPRRDLEALRDLRRAFEQERPDSVHTHSSKAGILGREAARAAGVPRIVHTVHGWGFTPETPAWLRALFIRLERREAAPACASDGRSGRERLVFVSEADREEGARLGIVRPDTGSVILPGIDLSPYRDMEEMREARRRIRARAGLREEEPAGGFLGRLAPQKDPRAVLEAAALLAGEFPKLRWLIVGDGPLDASLRGICDRDARLRERVRFCGLQADPAAWLCAFDFLFLPSLWEGTPLTIMEAMAAGTPVVASQLAGIRPLVAPLPSRGAQARQAGEDGTRGGDPAGTPAPLALLARPGDARDQAARIRELLLDPRATGARAEAARRHALARFGLPAMLDRLMEIYEGA